MPYLLLLLLCACTGLSADTGEALKVAAANMTEEQFAAFVDSVVTQSNSFDWNNLIILITALTGNQVLTTWLRGTPQNRKGLAPKLS